MPVRAARSGYDVPWAQVHVRVPAVYLKLAFWAFLAILPFRRISKLRAVSEDTGFESHPDRDRSREAALLLLRKNSFRRNS